MEITEHEQKRCVGINNHFYSSVNQVINLKLSEELYDAIQKPMAKGWLIGPVEKWEAQGAAKAFPELANALLNILGIDVKTL